MKRVQSNTGSCQNPTQNDRTILLRWLILIVERVLSVRVDRVNLVLPEKCRESQQLYGFFKGLGVEGKEGIQFSVTPMGAKPVLMLRRAEVDRPGIWLEGEGVEPFSYRNAGIPIETSMGGRFSPLLTRSASTVDDGTLTIEEVKDLLGEIVSGIDHIGVNLPVNMLPRRQWEGLKQDLSKGTALYRYPGHEWPFILPTTDVEYQSGQIECHSPRGPKFEWVYDEEAREPVIQLALRTSAERAKVEKLLPGPKAYSIPGLETHFRSVNVRSPWKGIGLRVDVYYADALEADWVTGKWLAEEGGRIHSQNG
ncbi:hypothetical protein [Rossellomorea marisflavi]|uniref:hypothetical protein n=1 Tax=Rossellomorea marisflavi TaxID=189381 RepID=UPI001EE1CEE9|nr:hypothetical protein [Rossellomorea marisflavi]UKS64440.1 hypothetical protein K6T23_16865 [Rossellomorea marisflavi]